MNGTEQSVGQDHRRRVFSQAVDWYKNADAKAQVVLTLDGAFITFLGSARKHVWVNRAFVLAALGVCVFLGSAVSYIVHL